MRFITSKDKNYVNRNNLSKKGLIVNINNPYRV